MHWLADTTTDAVEELQVRLGRVMMELAEITRHRKDKMMTEEGARREEATWVWDKCHPTDMEVSKAWEKVQLGLLSIRIVEVKMDMLAMASSFHR